MMVLEDVSPFPGVYCQVPLLILPGVVYKDPLLTYLFGIGKPSIINMPDP